MVLLCRVMCAGREPRPLCPGGISHIQPSCPEPGKCWNSHVHGMAGGMLACKVSVRCLQSHPPALLGFQVFPPIVSVLIGSQAGRWCLVPPPCILPARFVNMLFFALDGQPRFAERLFGAGGLQREIKQWGEFLKLLHPHLLAALCSQSSVCCRNWLPVQVCQLEAAAMVGIWR